MLHNAMKNKPPFKYEKTEYLGDGASGEVSSITYDRNMFHHESKNPPENLVVKTVSASKFNPSEPGIQNRYHYTLAPFKLEGIFDDEIAWITEKIDGKKFDFSNTKNVPYEILLNLVAQLAAKLNLHHHYTPSTRSAVVHGDLSVNNILFDVQEENATIDLIDYGLSFDIEFNTDDNPNKIFKTPHDYSCLNHNYFAPEALEGFFCPKTDI
jgi:hypothetical protein